MIVRNCSLQGDIRDVRLDRDTIVAVGTGLTAQAGEEEYDALKNVVLAGLADAHMHLDKSMLIPREPYLDVTAPEKGRRTREQKAQLSEEDIYHNARSVIERAIRNGTVAIRTNVDVDPVVGLRGVRALLKLREELQGLVTLQVVPFAQEGVFNFPDTPVLLREALSLGCDGVGGHTIIDGDGKAEAHIDTILEIAAEYDVTCDFHVDESGKPEHFVLPYLAQRTIDLKRQGKVNAIHACSLANVDDKTAEEAIAIARDAELRFIIAPTAISTRSLTRSKELFRAGLPVSIGSDNVGDFFNPLGSAHVLHVAGLLTYVHRYFTAEETDEVLSMATDMAEGLFHRPLGAGGIREGAPGNITVLEGTNSREVIGEMDRPRLVIRSGRVVFQRYEANSIRNDR